MANISLDELLRTERVTRLISRIKTPQTLHQDFWGMGPGGANTNPVGGHVAGWDIFDKTRKLAPGRAPGTGPGTMSLNPVSHVSAQLYRAHGKMFLLEEKIFRTRPLGGQWGEVDVRGQNYVTKQADFLAQQFRNNREWMVNRMMHGSFDMLKIGDDWLPTLAGDGNSFTVDYQVPAGNKNQLNMLGAGNIITVSWANPNATISADCLAINAAYEQLHGFPLRHAWCNTTMLNNLFNNTDLINKGGIANVMFTDYTPMPTPSPEGIPNTGFLVRFKGIPWLTWHVTDMGLDINTSTTSGAVFTKFWADTEVGFFPDPTNLIAEMMEGSEPVAENVVDPATERFGMAAWTERTTQPAGFELLALDNALPAVYIPKALAIGTVVF